MERAEKRRIAEALILGCGEPLSSQRLAEIVPRCKPAEAKELVNELNAEYIAQGRAFEICEVAGGFQLRTLPEFAPYLQQTHTQRPLRLSQAALETLAIVAYRQPVTRAEVEHVRGVDVGAVVRSLLERRLVRIAGNREVPGRPLLYATTRRFLEVFGLARLEDLPTLRDIEEFAPEGVAAAQARLAAEAASALDGSSEASAGEEPRKEGLEPAGAEPAEQGDEAVSDEGDAPILPGFGE
jgi:segregation and condensation protein B